MRAHLDIQINPFDASLETVMPGVQERFNGLATTIHSVKADMQSSFQCVTSDISELKSSNDYILSSVQEIKEVTNLQMTAMHAVVQAVSANEMYEEFKRKMAGGNIYEEQTNTTANAPNPTTDTHGNEIRTVNTTRENESQVQMSPPVNHPRLSPQFSSLSMLWNEWYGIGGEETNDKPIPGGFAELERTQKSKWRKHFDASQGRSFTRIRLIVDGIEKMKETLEITTEAALYQLEPEWTRLKKSPDAMVRYLQEMGYTKKAKPRGKSSRQMPGLNDS